VEQRKGRASRTCPRMCYHLYSTETYKEMRETILPEILRVQLSHAVLKLYKFGPADILRCNFIDQPDEYTLREALEIFTFVGAINNKGLTNTSNPSYWPVSW